MTFIAPDVSAVTVIEGAEQPVQVGALYGGPPGPPGPPGLTPDWWAGTQLEWEAIPTKDPETLYIIHV